MGLCVFSPSVRASAPFAHGHRWLPAAGAVSMPTSQEEGKKEEHSPTPWNGTPNSSQQHSAWAKTSCQVCLNPQFVREPGHPRAHAQEPGRSQAGLGVALQRT